MTNPFTILALGDLSAQGLGEGGFEVCICFISQRNISKREMYPVWSLGDCLLKSRPAVADLNLGRTSDRRAQGTVSFFFSFSVLNHFGEGAVAQW